MTISSWLEFGTTNSKDFLRWIYFCNIYFSFSKLEKFSLFFVVWLVKYSKPTILVTFVVLNFSFGNYFEDVYSKIKWR